MRQLKVELHELELFVSNLEGELDKAIRSVLDELTVPRQIEIQGLWVSFVDVNEIGTDDNKYIPQRPAIKLSVSIGR